MMKASDIEQRALRTAMYAATHRYLSLFETNPEFQSQDSLSGLFVPALWRFLFRFAWLRHVVRNQLHNNVPGTYEYVIARTKFFDEQFARALERGIPQIVILGAGYDTRAVRQQRAIHGTRIFELDTAILQAGKKRVFERNDVSIPDELTFCPITFGKDSIANTLAEVGYDSTKRTLFLWEGVSYYLSEQAVLETFAFIKNNAASGSGLVFDYFYKSIIDGDHDCYGARELTAAVVKEGVPFQFGIESARLEQFLSDLGFDLLVRQGPEELEQQYLTSHGNRLGKVYGFAECVHAILK